MNVIEPRPNQERLAPTGADGDDLVLCRRSAAGDRAAFEVLYRRHAARIYGLALRLTGDPVEAEVLVQDTFVKAWFAVGSFSGEGSLAGWLARVAVNRWRDRLRSGGRGRRLREALTHEARADEPTAPQPGTGPRAASGVVPLLLAVDLERAVARLPQGARSVYVLHDVEGYTHPEIAELLGLAVGTTKAHLHRARRLLRLMLTEPREAAHEA